LTSNFIAQLPTYKANAFFFNIVSIKINFTTFLRIIQASINKINISNFLILLQRAML
jgi:hypothetical protein